MHNLQPTYHRLIDWPCIANMPLTMPTNHTTPHLLISLMRLWLAAQLPKK